MRLDWPGHMTTEWRHAMAARAMAAALNHFEHGTAELGKMARGSDPVALAHIALSAAMLGALAVTKETVAQIERHWAARCKALEDRIKTLEGRKP